MKRKPSLGTTALALAAFLALPTADAATTSATFSLNIDVLQGGSCTLSASGFSATYDPGSPNPVASYVTPGLTCTYNTAWSLSFDQGQNPGPGSTCSSPARRVANGPSIVAYELYTDSGYTQPLGCDPANDIDGIGTGGTQYPFVYYRLPAGQSPTATGSHSDVVVMTLTF